MKFKQITNKSYTHYEGKVYDLTVEDVHSYNINNLVVHNSGGGSLVAYAAGITQIDPLQYGLIFERFLNPERGHLPDIDSDFCVEKGWMVFDYLIKKYGREYSCNIATFGRLQLKAVIKDIAKALGIPFEEVNEVTRSIPEDIKHINELIEMPEYRDFFKKYPDIYTHASKLEGSPRHVSQHPAGIAITPIPVTDLLPVQNAKETQEGVTPGYLTQFEKEQSEISGLVKLDILKLKNVTEIRKQLQMINKLYGKNYTEQTIPLDDPKTWELFEKGDTLGVFQFASNVAIPVIKKIKCKDIEELAAANSFIRPGTSGLDEYIAGKINPSSVKQLDPRFMKHISNTFGAIVFQEQIMGLISELMGISFGQADLYRRALEKPHKDKKGYVKKFQEEGVDIAVSRGFKKEEAELIKNAIIDNSGYAFNKSHAVAYSLISYWTAWIKVNYPLVFYTQMFNGNLEQLSDFMEEAKKRGMTIKPPHVCYSKYDSIIEDEGNKVIRIGLNAVKGIGPAAVESIINAQPFSSMDDFFERNNLRSVNKRVIEASIKANAFENLPIKIELDDIPENVRSLFDIETTGTGKTLVKLSRSQMWFWYEKVNEINAVKSVPNYAVPTSMIKGRYMDIYELATEEDNTIIIPEDMLDKFELTIDMVSGFRTRKRPKGFLKLTHDDGKKVPVFRKPFVQFNYEMSQIKESYLQSYLKEIEEFGYSFISHPLEPNVNKMQIFGDVEDGYMMVTAGIITEILQRTTKTNKKYYWIMLRTPRDIVRLTFWDNQFKQYKDILQKYKLLLVKGTKGYGGLTVDSVREIKVKC